MPTSPYVYPERFVQRHTSDGVATPKVNSEAELQRLAYAVSHDLRQPARVVTSFGQLLARHLEPETDDKSAKYLKHIIENSLKMQSMLDAVLAYSRIETHGRPLARVESKPLVMSTIKILRANRSLLDEEISMGELPVIWGDSSQLGQLFLEIIDNAARYRGKAPLKVRVSAEKRHDGWAEFSIEDNGRGIRPADRNRVFDIFQRIHTDADHDSEAPEGTGVGLALARRIVQRHGGDLWVTPTFAGGSTFSFTLPAHPSMIPT